MCGNFTNTQTGTTRREMPHNIPRTHRRFKNGAWQKPTSKGRGWKPSSGLANMTYEQGLDYLATLNSTRLSQFTDVTTPDQIPAVVLPAVNEFSRRFNTALGIWEKPNFGQTAWIPSSIKGTYAEGLDYLARNFPANFFNVTVTGDIGAGAEMVPMADGNPAAGYGIFGTRFAPVLTVLPNGGMTLTVDAPAAASLARAVVSTTKQGAFDTQYLAELRTALKNDPFRTPTGASLYTDVVKTLRTLPFGE